MKEEELISGNLYYIDYHSNDSYLFKCERDGNACNAGPFITIDMEKMNPKSFYRSAGNFSNTNNSSFKGRDYVPASTDMIELYNQCVLADRMVEYKFNKQKESFIDLIF